MSPQINLRTIILVAGSFAALLWFLSGLFWAVSAGVEIRNNMDAFIGDLQRAGYWNSWAALTAFAAAVASGVVAACEIIRALCD
jgi:hypothetical protein